MKKADFSDLGQRLGISPVMARVLVNRGFATAEEQEYYLYGTLDSIPDSKMMLGMEPAHSPQYPACFTPLSVNFVALTRFRCTLSARMMELLR